MLYPCILCVALLMDMFVLCVACLTMFVNCLVKQYMSSQLSFYNEPTSCLVQPIGTHSGEVMYFGFVWFRAELGFLNCDDICTCVVNKRFERLEFILIPFMLTCSMMRFHSFLLLGLCPVFMWSSLVCCEVVVIPYVDSVVAVTVVRVRLFVCCMCVC